MNPSLITEQWTRDRCQTECSGRDACVAWTWFTGGGWCELYSDIEPEHKWREDSDAYTVINDKANYDCPPQPCFTGIHLPSSIFFSKL